MTLSNLTNGEIAYIIYITILICIGLGWWLSIVYKDKLIDLKRQFIGWKNGKENTKRNRKKIKKN